MRSKTAFLAISTILSLSPALACPDYYQRIDDPKKAQEMLDEAKPTDVRRIGIGAFSEAANLFLQKTSRPGPRFLRDLKLQIQSIREDASAQVLYTYSAPRRQRGGNGPRYRQYCLSRTYVVTVKSGVEGIDPVQVIRDIDLEDTEKR